MPHPIPDNNIEDNIEAAGIKRSFLFPILLILFVVGAIGAGVYLMVLRETDPPHRVLVLLSTETHDGHISRWWIEDDANQSSRALSKTVNATLERMHFDTFDMNTRTLRDALRNATTTDQIRAVAQDLHVGHVILGGIRVVEQKPVKGTNRIRRTLRLDWSIMDVESGALTPVVTPPLELHFSSQEEDIALATAWDWATPAMLTHVLLSLAQQPRLSSLRPENRAELSTELQHAGIRLEDFFTFVKIYTEDIELAAADAAAALRNLQERDAGSYTRTILGSAMDQEVFFGPGPGDQIVMMREPHAPFRFIDANNYTLMRRDEQLILASPDGKTRQVIYEFFSFFRDEASVSADGQWVATFLEYPHAAKELVVISVADHSARPLYVHMTDDFFLPTFSPDAQQIAFFRQDTVEQFALQVIRADGTQDHPLQLGYDTPAWPAPIAWSPDSRWIYTALRPTRRGQPSIWRFRTADADATPLLGADALPPPPPRVPEPASDLIQSALMGFVLGSSAATESTPTEHVFPLHAPPPLPPDPRYTSQFTLALASPDGAALWVREIDLNGASHLGHFDLATKKYTRTIENLRFDAPKLSPDGSALAFVAQPTDPDPRDPHPYDDEIFVVRLQPSPGAPQRITRNHHQDTLQGWSRDGQALFVGADTRAASPDPCRNIEEACELLFRIDLKTAAP